MHYNGTPAGTGHEFGSYDEFAAALNKYKESDILD